MRRIGKVGFESYAARGLEDLVVDEIELAFVELDRVILIVGLDRERAFG